MLYCREVIAWAGPIEQDGRGGVKTSATDAKACCQRIEDQNARWSQASDDAEVALGEQEEAAGNEITVQVLCDLIVWGANAQCEILSNLTDSLNAMGGTPPKKAGTGDED